jgi:hypothetical protein
MPSRHDEYKQAKENSYITQTPLEPRFVSLADVCCDNMHCKRSATAGLARLYIASTSAAKLLSASAWAERELATCARPRGLTEASECDAEHDDKISI